MALMPDGRTLVVANGGIETRPDYPRAKRNVRTMAPTWLEGLEVCPVAVGPCLPRMNRQRTCASKYRSGSTATGYPNTHSLTCA